MVQIASRQQRNLVTGAFVNLIPDVLVSLALAYAYGLTGFIVALVGLQLVYLALWLKRTIWTWFLFLIVNRRHMADHLTDWLAKNSFPRPPPFLNDMDDYFARILSDSTLDCALRVKAATEVGTMVGFKTAQRYSLLLQTHMAFEDAIERYARSFPPDGGRLG